MFTPTVLTLLAVTVFLCVVIVKIENERYALLVGLCPNTHSLAESPTSIGDRKKDPFACLQHVQTRTSPLWHLFYAVRDTVT
jgi:hypothetical protein